MESLLGYHPCSIGFLTSHRDPVMGQCQAGSLTGAVASERVSAVSYTHLNPIIDRYLMLKDTLIEDSSNGKKYRVELGVDTVSYTHLLILVVSHLRLLRWVLSLSLPLQVSVYVRKTLRCV